MHIYYIERIHDTGNTVVSKHVFTTLDDNKVQETAESFASQNLAQRCMHREETSAQSLVANSSCKTPLTEVGISEKKRISSTMSSSLLLDQCDEQAADSQANKYQQLEDPTNV